MENKTKIWKTKLIYGKQNKKVFIKYLKRGKWNIVQLCETKILKVPYHTR